MKTLIYKDEEYRDDRLFVINLTYGKKNNEPMWILRTYRNTIRLRPYKDNCFDKKDDAIEYLKSIEHNTPLISNNARPLEIPNDVIDKWSYFNDWLEQRGLFSAILERQHCNYDRDSRGYDFLENYASVREVEHGFVQKFFPNGKVMMEGNYNRGMKEGEWKSYHESGNLNIHCFYKNDWIDGLYKRFHENGVLASKGILIENDQEGEWQYFDENGNQTDTKLFKNGELIS